LWAKCLPLLFLLFFKKEKIHKLLCAFRTRCTTQDKEEEEEEEEEWEEVTT
jgi:hypothetical protein